MTTFSRHPTPIAAILMQGDRTFAHDAQSAVISRESACECGAPFTQWMLSARFLEICEKVGSIGAVTQQIPELYVPVHCPPCERRDLRRAARIAALRQAPAPDYTSRRLAEAAD